MKDLGSLMKQAQAMQEKLQQAQARLASTLVQGTSGGGMVKLSLAGNGELRSVIIDEVLMQPGEGEVLADLIVAAHADAKRKLDEAQAELMKEVAGPLAGMGLPGMKF
jgi:DNA-binding YbaB/EbfC family protein